MAPEVRPRKTNPISPIFPAPSLLTRRNHNRRSYELSQHVFLLLLEHHWSLVPNLIFFIFIPASSRVSLLAHFFQLSPNSSHPPGGLQVFFPCGSNSFPHQNFSVPQNIHSNSHSDLFFHKFISIVGTLGIEPSLHEPSPRTKISFRAAENRTRITPNPNRA